MELRYPLLPVIGILVLVLFLIFFKAKKRSYTKGTKVANTKYIKENPYYKKKVENYKKMLLAIKSLCIFSMLISLLLLARPSKAEVKDNSIYNRDIVLCMDISSSVYELDNELVTNLKDTVRSLKGERFSVAIFNTTTVTLSPLTDDYEYVLEVLDNIELGIDAALNIRNYDWKSEEYEKALYYRNYIESGTLVDNPARGSSIIGDGLASCVYNFSNIDEERTRILIFATDNEDYSKKKIVTLEEAAQIAQNKKIMLFGIGTTNIKSKDEQEMKSVFEGHGGKYYSEKETPVKDIVADIEKTSKSLLKGQVETKKVDKPEIPFIMLLLSTVSFLLLSKKVML